MILDLAVKARLPIIAVSTRDTLNLYDVLKEITGMTAQNFQLDKAEVKPKTLYVFALADGAKLPLIQLYPKFVAVESSLILVNPSKIIEPMFDAGELPAPRHMIEALMEAVTDDKEKAHLLTRALGGCTIREAAEYARLTMARDNSLTVDGVTHTRRTSFQGANGLTQIDTAQIFYQAPDDLVEWTAKEKTFFLEDFDLRLRPRGLMFDGPPGTGKTAAAKYIAKQFGISLFRFDVGGTKNKYVGASEANMISNLARLDQEEPCVVLLDEVEKVFNSNLNDSTGTTTTMLSQLLWWLAERQSRVLVVMTTNKAKALPKELYREGRIDKVMNFNGLLATEAPDFVKQVMASFKEYVPGQTDVLETIKLAPTIPDTTPLRYSQASLTTAVHSRIKQVILDKAGQKAIPVLS